MAARKWILWLTMALGAVRAGAEGLAVGEWRVEDGTYEAASDGRALYGLTGQPYVIGEGSVEATVVVKRRRATAGWAAAGVMVSGDSGNLWVLGIVEGPGGERYTELMERCQGVHQAQGTGVTRLTPIAASSGGTWEYGKTYRLRLSLTRDGITGDITEVATGRSVAKHGYLFGGVLAVRDGWATLRAEEFDAEFAEVKVVAAPAAPAAGARAYPQGKRGCVGLYLGDDMPGAEPASKLTELTRVLRAAGLTVAPLTSRALAEEGALTFPGLRYLAADLRRLPAGALLPLKRWGQQGDVLVSLAAPAFGSFFYPGQAGWITWEQYTQAKLQDFGRDARPVVAWSDQELANWQQTLGGDAKRPAAVRLAGEAPDHRPAATSVVPHFGNGWWSLDRRFDSPPARAGEQLVCFWAKGDDKTRDLSLEIREKDDSRWVGVVSLTPEWRYCVLQPQAFAYWRENASKGRGAPGAEVRLENAVEFRWGLSGTHTSSVLAADAAEHHLTVGSVALAAAPPAALAGLGPAPLPVGEYTVITVLTEGGRTTDTVTHPLMVRARSQQPPASEVVRREGGRFLLDGKPWRPVGVNYWPHNLGGTPTDVYANGWLDPVSYQPSVLEADLAQLERWGCRAIAAVGAEIHWGTSEDTPQLRNLQEFLWRCQRHRLKVLLFVGGLDPRGRDDEGARRVIRAVRHHPALMGYDIAWEPYYGAARKAYTPHWRDWLVQQYGSLEQAEAAFGYALPRGAEGTVDAPPRTHGSQRTAPGGRWRRPIAPSWTTNWASSTGTQPRWFAARIRGAWSASAAALPTGCRRSSRSSNPRCCTSWTGPGRRGMTCRRTARCRLRRGCRAGGFAPEC
ncbi:MAG: hypothetical protein COS65_14360 [Armatimonadetes bacterium CG06_land_8_20_14_3_00_66_21]|nr:MAG: hypothetical protein COS65_14360 [Armatimonadetes bacterium CG06_land_8_20_14_3_00_66_21]